MTSISMKRRALAAMATAFTLAPIGAWAQALGGDKPLRMIVPLAAGSTVDAVARAVAPALGRGTGHPVVVENVAGAGGIPGTQQIVRAPRTG